MAGQPPGPPRCARPRSRPFLRADDVTPRQLREVFDLADALKRDRFRGKEIAASAIDGKASLGWDVAGDLMTAQTALLTWRHARSREAAG